MAKNTISPEADQDTADIVAFLTREAGATVALRYRSDFDNLFERLAMFPRSGASRPRLGHSIRIGVVEPYVPVYEFDEDHVIVLRVLDGRRNIARRLLRR
jgi:plasmid stabilization system protein ParE